MNVLELGWTGDNCLVSSLSFMKSVGSPAEYKRGLAILRTVSLTGLTYLCSILNLPATETASDRMFERFKALAGEWEGTFEWSHGRTESGKLKATYYLTGNGSALVENLIMGDAPTMTTVYHLDGADLRMTHYCGARNQPRLKATHICGSLVIAKGTRHLMKGKQAAIAHLPFENKISSE